MNYEKIYNQIVQRGKIRVLTGYKENHHIVPRSLGGDNSVANLVYLTAKEHYLCHKLLAHLHPHNSKLQYAFWAMCNQRSCHQQRKYRVSGRTYEAARKAAASAISSMRKGSKSPEQSLMMKLNNPNNMPGVKEKQSLAKLGELNSSKRPEVRKKISNIKKGQKHSEAHKQALSVAAKNRPKIACPHCSVIGPKGIMSRWHFDRCKEKK